MKAHVSRFARHGLRLLLSATALLAIVLGVFSTARPVAAETSLICSEQTLSVTLAPGATDTYHIVGTLCSQGPAAGKTAQLLMHGVTYARYYWDLPYQNEHYSYVLSATKRGYATFNIDRIGYGASDHPAGTLADLDANAYVTHQIVQALRAGDVASTKFAKVIVVGHSMGSFTTIRYAAMFPGEANGIILTGLVNDLNWPVINATMMVNLYPATLDPKFLGQFPDGDYLTTKPGSRSAFYYLPNTDPQVLTVDENLKQTVTVGELAGAWVLTDPTISSQIVGPVQLIVGQYDFLFCGNLVNCSDKAAVQTYEEGFFSSACLETAVINDAGHDLNLHLNAGATYSTMLSWADRNVGRTADTAPKSCPAP